MVYSLLIDDLTHGGASRHAARQHLDDLINAKDEIENVEDIVEKWGTDAEAERQMNSDFWERF